MDKEEVMRLSEEQNIQRMLEIAKVLVAYYM